MKKIISFLLIGVLAFLAVGCGGMASDGGREQQEHKGSTEGPVISVKTVDGQKLTIQLNDSKAAQSLYAQLPLDINLSNYSDNEKIFYPPEKLVTADTPQTHNTVGTLAYFEPWGDVVIFYGPFKGNEDLYELGHVTEGVDSIQNLTGQVKLEPVSP